MSNLIGTQTIGLRMPIIKEGDNLENIIYSNLENLINNKDIVLHDNDVICITESLVARSEGNYITVQDIANDIEHKFGKNQIISVVWPIYSRNRFSMILKGIARAAKEVRLLLNKGKDEVGNDIINKFTNINIIDFYREIIESENCKSTIVNTSFIKDAFYTSGKNNIIIATIHNCENLKNQLIDEIDRPLVKIYTLSEICANENSNTGYNEDWGLLGSNKATEEKLKLFPKYDTCEKLCESLKSKIYENFGVNVELMVYGDGCFKDPMCGIWEFADPTTTVYYTNGLIGTPNEVKMKYLIDSAKENNISNINEFVKKEIVHKDSDLKGNMKSQGTTPRRYVDLLASLADLTSGSGDKGTPVVLIQNYFKNYMQ